MRYIVFGLVCGTSIYCQLSLFLVDLSLSDIRVYYIWSFAWRGYNKGGRKFHWKYDHLVYLVQFLYNDCILT